MCNLSNFTVSNLLLHNFCRIIQEKLLQEYKILGTGPEGTKNEAKIKIKNKNNSKIQANQIKRHRNDNRLARSNSKIAMKTYAETNFLFVIFNSEITL